MVSTLRERFQITHRIQKSICLPATNIRIILTWIFCAGVKNIPMYIIFYPRISASVRIFCKSMELTRGAEKVTFVSANNHYEVDDLKIQTLLSTDAGVAFYVNVRGVSIFHAGDLNDWKMEHVGELINGKQERTFRHEIRKLADKPVNFAFVPMDPRLGPYQTLGIDFVLKTPMQNLFSRCICGRIILQSGNTKNTLQILEWQTA